MTVTRITGCVRPVPDVHVAQRRKNHNPGIVPPWLQQPQWLVVWPQPVTVEDNTPVVMRTP